MATWIAHLRVADQILKALPYDRLAFLAGNVGPDSGLPNEDYSKFDPPKKITHFLVEERQDHPSSKIASQVFLDTYLRDQVTDYKIGYYSHLLTDVKWSEMQGKKIDASPDLYAPLKTDSNFVWEIKKDWYGLDFKYIYESSSAIFDEFKSIESLEDQLDFFPPGALDKQIKYIQDYYSQKERWPKGKGIYLSEEEMNVFVEETSNYIIDKLKKVL